MGAQDEEGAAVPVPEEGSIDGRDSSRGAGSLRVFGSTSF